MMEGFKGLLLKLFQDQRGSVAVWLVLTFVFVFGGMALAVDLTRVFAFKTRLEIAAEAASLIAAKNLHVLDATGVISLAREIARQKIEENSFPSVLSAPTTLRNFSLEKTTNEIGVVINIDAGLSTTLLGAFNFLNDFDVAATAVSEMSLSKSELIMVLDSSVAAGDIGRASNITEAAEYISDKFNQFHTYGSNVKIAIIPNANALVNVAPHKEWIASGVWPDGSIPPAVPGINLWTGELEDQRWCVESRGGNSATSTETSNFIPFPLVMGIDKITGADGIDRFEISTDENCAQSAIRPLKSTYSDLSGYFVNITPTGQFASGRSFVWAERLLSPSWQDAWGSDVNSPAQYDAGVKKIVLLITSSGNNGILAEDTVFMASCERLRQKDVSVFIIDYGAPITSSTKYKSCVTWPGNYRKVDNVSELKSAAADFVKSQINSRLVSLD